MNGILQNMVVKCLEELGDRQLQEDLWLAKIRGKQSSFGEAVERLFTDSGLEDALEKGKATGFPSEVDMQLRELQKQLAKMDLNAHPTQLFGDPAMSRVREMAGSILQLLQPR